MRILPLPSSPVLSSPVLPSPVLSCPLFCVLMPDVSSSPCVPRQMKIFQIKRKTISDFITQQEIVSVPKHKLIFLQDITFPQAIKVTCRHMCMLHPSAKDSVEDKVEDRQRSKVKNLAVWRRTLWVCISGWAVDIKDSSWLWYKITEAIRFGHLMFAEGNPGLRL